MRKRACLAYAAMDASIPPREPCWVGNSCTQNWVSGKRGALPATGLLPLFACGRKVLFPPVISFMSPRMAPKSCPPWKGKSARAFLDVWSADQHLSQSNRRRTTANTEILESNEVVPKAASQTYLSPCLKDQGLHHLGPTPDQSPPQKTEVLYCQRSKDVVFPSTSKLLDRHLNDCNIQGFGN